MTERRKRHCCHKFNRVSWVKGHGDVMFVHWAATCFYPFLSSCITNNTNSSTMKDGIVRLPFSGAYTATFRVQLSPIVLVIVVYIYDVHSFLIWPLNKMAAYMEKLRIYNPYYCSHCTERPIFFWSHPSPRSQKSLGRVQHFQYRE